VIAVQNLSKTYNTGAAPVHALRETSFEISSGEFVAVMGPSGSGKSTLMNLLGCLDTPSGGCYRLDGVAVEDMGDEELARVRNQKIGFVFQTFNLLPRMTAQRNVELPMLYAGVGAEERKKRALEALDQVGLSERAHHKPNQMSGGQNQRVAIARALVNKPAVILADEPTGNLDSTASEEIMVIFQRLNRNGVTVVVVTHELEIAKHSGRILNFRDGRLLKDEIVEAPVNAELLLQKTHVGEEAAR